MYKFVLKLLAKSMQILSKKDTNIRQVFAELPPNLIIKMSDLSGKIVGIFALKNGEFFWIKNVKNFEQKIDMEIVVKSSSSLKKMLLGKMSCKDAFNQHEIVLYGNIFDAMKLIRVIDTTEQYIFPKFYYKHIFDKEIQKKYSKFKFYLCLIFSKLIKL